MTESNKPRQLEPGEFLHTQLREHERYRTRERWEVAGKLVHEDMATVEAACIAKGRAEAEAGGVDRDILTRLNSQLLAAEAQLAALQATAPRWIPTSERLPEVGELVLIRGVSTRTWVDLCALEAATEDGDQWFASEGWGRAHDTRCVTHWMTLPPLPSEET